MFGGLVGPSAPERRAPGARLTGSDEGGWKMFDHWETDSLSELIVVRSKERIPFLFALSLCPQVDPHLTYQF
jgi:hypothetical protein